MNIAKVHVLVVHFPIALTFAAVLAEALWLITRKEAFKHAGLYCLVLAVASALSSIITGLARESSMEFIGDDKAIVTSHKAWATVSFVVGVLTVSARLVLLKLQKRWLRVAYATMLTLLAVCIAATGYYGGVLVHG